MRRIQRINSLLIEVLSEVIRRDIKDPRISNLLTVMSADISPDLKYATISISVIGPEEVKKTTLQALIDLKGIIAVYASKKVVLRYFPELKFVLDESIDKQMRIEELLNEIHAERQEKSDESR